MLNEIDLLRQDPGARAVFCPDGLPPRPGMFRPADVVRQPALAATLRRIAANGADEMRTGDTASALAAFVQGVGGLLTEDDLAAQMPTVDTDPPQWVVGGASLTEPLRTGVASVVQMLRLMDAQRVGGRGDEVSESRRWTAMRAAMRDRLEYMSADPLAGTDWEALLSPERAVHHLVAPPTESLPAGRGGCTSQVTLADGEGAVVSLTQTILDLFGARMVDPTTGVVLNDAMTYFDPRPGAVNRVRAKAVGLSAVCPVVIEVPDLVAGIGAAGGRRIISCVAQLVDALVDGVDPQRAIDRPRLHVEGDDVVVDERMPGVVDALRADGWSVAAEREAPTSWHFARPSAVARRTGAAWAPGTDRLKPYGIRIA